MSFTRREFVRFAGAMPFLPLLPKSIVADPATPAISAATPAATTSASTPATAFTVGDFTKIYDPSAGETSPWYINDHTFIYDANKKTWHLFGITHAEPANPLDEKFFAHATAPDLMGPWTKQDSVLPFEPKISETLVWAPHCIEHDGTYYMFYCGGGEDHTKYRIDLATSKDLTKWERSSTNPIVIDGFDARDPMVLQVTDTWIMYYCATSEAIGGNHVVKAMTSTDLVKWTAPQEVFRSPATGTSGGPTESPFVVYRDGKYYLFVCGKDGYKDTVCYASDDPLKFDYANQVGDYPAHASEIVTTSDGKYYASAAGWGQGGVYLAELKWKE